MKIITRIKDIIRYWFLKRAHKKLKREKKLTGYHQASSFAIIYDASEEENYRSITMLVKELQQDNKKVKTLGYVVHKKMPDYCFPKLTFEFCNGKSFSWNQQPVAKNVKDFLNSHYEVMIDLTSSDFHHVKYLLAVSKASLKVGLYSEKYLDIYDFLIQLDDSSTHEERIKQTFHYLKMIHNEPIEQS